MISEDELKGMTDEQLESKWQGLARLKAQMVGTLYPGIVQDEMIQIQLEQSKRKYGGRSAR